jgi:AraC-like DNA-binding protein
VFEETDLDSPFVAKIWRTVSVSESAFISVAASHSELVVARQSDGRSFVTVRGPETVATSVPIPPDMEFFGIQFKPGTFIPCLSNTCLVDRSVALPELGNGFFALDSASVEIPGYHNADVFVENLVRKALLTRDSVIELVLNGEMRDLSLRSIQRRFLRATGLTHATFRQIERAHTATDLLDRGLSIPETVHRAGYADQAHLTRSLRRFFGQTPSQIIRARSA